MTFPEILEAIDTLSNAELARIQEHIYQKQVDSLPDLSVFDNFSDEQLWDVVHQPFNAVQNIRLHQLTDKRQMGHRLTSAEQYEVEQLVQAYDRFVLIRSMAMVVLQNRGIDVMGELAKS